jgi:hypothetical protein
MSTFHCAESFAYSPTSPYDYQINNPTLPEVLNLTNTLNVPFDSKAFVQQRASLPGLPRWPASKLYPIQDKTVNMYDVIQPQLTDDVNDYHDILALPTPPYDIQARHHESVFNDNVVSHHEVQTNEDDMQDPSTTILNPRSTNKKTLNKTNQIIIIVASIVGALLILLLIGLLM